MKFTSLSIRNFLAITEADLNLADRGMVLIEGINEADTSAKSNGSGKSSIADALCWCWFGTTARDVSGDDVVNRITGKDCSVRSVVEDGGFTYTATRHRKHKTGKNSLTLTVSDGLSVTDLTKGTDKLTQEVADKIIGASLAIFVGSIYAGQERMPDLPAMTDKVLKMLIEEAAGVTVLEEAHKHALEDRKAAQSNVAGFKEQLAKADQDIDNIQFRITTLEAQATNWLDVHNENLDRERSRLKEQLGVMKANEKKLAEFDKPAKSGRFLQLGAIMEGVERENTELKRLEREAGDRMVQLTTARTQLGLAENRRDVAITALERVKHKIGCPCDSCGRPLTEAELEATTKIAENAVEKARKEVKEWEHEVHRFSHEHGKAQFAVDAYRATMTDVTKVAAELGDLTAALSTHNLELKLNSTLRDQLAADGKKFKDKLAEENPILPGIQVQRRELQKAKDARALILALVIKAEQDLQIADEVVKIYGAGGVRARILDEVTPYLNAQTANYLSVLSDGNIDAVWTTLTKNSKGEFREKFSIDVTHAKGGENFRSISGGEKRKVRIATALALQDLVATRATKPIDIFIGDEIDDALDSAGLERLMMILEEKARERGSVFIISHNDLKDMCKNVVTIRKAKDGRTILTETAA